MSLSEATLKLLVDHIVDKNALVAVLASISADMSDDIRRQSDDSRTTLDALARRRAYDRERMKAKRLAEKSADSRTTSADETTNGVSLKEIPHTPLENNPSPENIISTTGAREAKAKRGTRVPEDFWPNATSIAKAAKLGIPVTVELVNSFLDYWRGVPGSKGLKCDWQGTFRNHLDFWTSRKGRNGNGYNTRDSIEQAIDFRRWEEAQGSGNGGDEDTALLPGLRESAA